MAKYTVELGSMVSAHAHLIDVRANQQDIKLVGAHYDGISEDGFDYASWDFVYNTHDTPVKISEDFALPFMLTHIGQIDSGFTNQSDLNTQILNKEMQAFVRHFWGYEIGQENPEYWCLLARDFFDENQGWFIQAYQQMMLNNQAFLTSTNQSKGVADSTKHGSAVAGTADTPQNELNFKINTGDPTDDYNFNYSSNVNGSKTLDTEDATTTNTASARGATIMSLIRQLEQFTNGIYFDLFTKAKNYGLFMQVIA